MKCKDCPYLVKREKISPMSRIIGYTAECARSGVLLKLEDFNKAPHWCPFAEEDEHKEDYHPSEDHI